MTALIFDCDGVLLDNMDLHAEIEVATLYGQGVAIDRPTLIRRFAGVSQKAVLAILSSETGIVFPGDFDLDASKPAVFAERLRAMPGMAETLAHLSPSHAMCVASGSRFSLLLRSLSATSLDRFFGGHVYAAEMVERGKPAPDLFLFAADRLRVQPEECIVIEDAVAGIVAARAANMRVIGFLGGSHCGPQTARDLMKAGADSLAEDAKALSAIIESMAKQQGA